MLADFIARRLLNTRPPQRADVYPIVASARPIFLLIAQFRPSPRAESQALGCIIRVPPKPAACRDYRCDDHSGQSRHGGQSLVGRRAESGGQASTMFRGPGAGLAPAQPCPCGAPMRARLRFEEAGGVSQKSVSACAGQPISIATLRRRGAGQKMRAPQKLYQTVVRGTGRKP